MYRGVKTDYVYAFTLLRHAEIQRVEHFTINRVAEFLKAVCNDCECPAAVMGSEPLDIFEQESPRPLCPQNCLDVEKQFPLVSAKPSPLPAMLNGWHGNPANRMSWSGISSGAMPLMSPKGVSPKFASYILRAAVSHSDENTLRHPFASKPSLMPPIPANKSIVLYACFMPSGIISAGRRGNVSARTGCRQRRGST